MKMQVTFCSQHGWTALHAAAENGKVDVVRLLIEAKAQVDIKTKVQYSLSFAFCKVKGCCITVVYRVWKNIMYYVYIQE